MPKAGVLYEEVASVADGLSAGGIIPTNHNVREKLGGGSDSTIHRHLQRWRASHQKQKEVIAELPPAISTPFFEFVNMHVSEAKSELSLQLAVEKADADALSDRCAELEAEKSEYLQNICDLSAQNELLRRQSQNHDQQFEALTGHVLLEQRRANTAFTDVAELRYELKTKTILLENQNAAIDRIIQEKNEAIAARINVEKCLAVAEANLASEKEKVASLSNDKSTLISQLNADWFSVATNSINAPSIDNDLVETQLKSNKVLISMVQHMMSLIFDTIKVQSSILGESIENNSLVAKRIEAHLLKALNSSSTDRSFQ